MLLHHAVEGLSADGPLHLQVTHPLEDFVVFLSAVHDRSSDRHTCCQSRVQLILRIRGLLSDPFQLLACLDGLVHHLLVMRTISQKPYDHAFQLDLIRHYRIPLLRYAARLAWDHGLPLVAAIMFSIVDLGTPRLFAEALIFALHSGVRLVLFIFSRVS